MTVGERALAVVEREGELHAHPGPHLWQKFSRTSQSGLTSWPNRSAPVLPLEFSNSKLKRGKGWFKRRIVISPCPLRRGHNWEEGGDKRNVQGGKDVSGDLRTQIARMLNC